MSLLTPSEALTASDAFLCSLYGDDMFAKWRQLKSEMRFVTERDYISWLLEVANDFRNKQNLTRITNDTESVKVEVGLQVRADDNCTVSQPLLDERQQNLRLESSAQLPSDITLCQRERLDKAELIQPSTSHDYYQKDAVDPGEEMVEGISLKHYLNGSAIKQEVSEVEDSEQHEGSFKLDQEPGVTVTMMNELSPENHIDCEDALLEGVSCKLEAPSGLIDAKNDKNVDVGKSGSKDTNDFVVQQEMSPFSPDGCVEQEYMSGDDCPSTTMSGLQHRSCSVNMRDVNGLSKSQQLHGKLHKKPYQCDECPYAAAQLRHLLTHKRKHTGERPYQCDECPYATAQLRHLLTHKRKHTGERPYRCDKCPYAAAHASQLVKHKHKHTGERPYRCDKCPYAAAKAGNLVTHKRKHTGEKPYQCDKCPYAAARASLLVAHQHKHTPEMPYRCDICPYATAYAAHLERHKRTHTDGKPYRCDKCPYAAV